MGIVVDIPYGETSVRAALPDHTFQIPMQASKPLTPLDDLPRAVGQALANPLGMPPLHELVNSGSRVTIAFDDLTVSAFGPIRAVVIREVMRQLRVARVSTHAITLLCANALHRKFSHDELAVVLGAELVREFGEQLICHDAEDAENLVYLGQTRSGYDVEISRHVVESDLTVYVNAAQFRGFSGGWKSVCVGLSTYRSIRHHHTPDGMSMSLKNNRMHSMLDEMGAFLEARIRGKIFKIDTIEADPAHSAYVVAGSTWDTRRAVVDKLLDHIPARRDLSSERYDVILYGVPDWSPYAIFASMNPLLTLVSSGLGYLGGAIQALGKPGCTVIMVTPCPKRWDHDHHPSYAPVWEQVLATTRDPYAIERRYSEFYATHAEFIARYQHQNAFHPIHAIFATQPLRRLQHCGQVIVAGIEDPTTAEHLGFAATSTVDDALRMAQDIHGADYSLAYAAHPVVPTKVTM